MHFVDYYEVLQISRNAEPETIHRVFRMLATRLHPDNPETGDPALFMQLKEAYETLKDEQRRASYDECYRLQQEQPLPVFGLKEFASGIEAETNRRIGILCLLYHKRRTDPEDPSISLLQLENLMAIPREHLRFTLWFLQEKRLIKFGDNSQYEISGEGIEYAESNAPRHEYLQKLLNSAQVVSPEPANSSPQPVASGPTDWNRPIQHPRPAPPSHPPPVCPPPAHRPLRVTLRPFD